MKIPVLKLKKSTVNFETPEIVIYEKLDNQHGFEELRADSSPATEKWSLPMMLKLAASGNYMKWQIGFNGQELVAICSYVNGKIREPFFTEVFTNNSNRTLQEQALLEARKKYADKYDEGYRPIGCLEPIQLKGMKGQEFTPGKTKLNYPVMVQPKYDGIRLLAQDRGVAGISLLSWTNKKVTTMDHLLPILKVFFANLPAYSTLDGELYLHDIDFSEIISAYSTRKKSHPLASKLIYHANIILHPKLNRLVSWQRRLLKLEVDDP